VQTLANGARVESVSIAIALDVEAFQAGEAASVANLAAAAANVAPENITVQNYSFFQDAAEEILPEEETLLERYMIPGAIAAGVLLLVAAMVLILLARRRKQAALAAAEAGAAAMAAEAERLVEYDEEGLPIRPPEGIEIGPIAPMKNRRREEIQEFAKSNPEITAQMIKSLLKAETE
jgi:flagellar biosynthesis/type III secretory pathway M-ring protein FliF/YscJ